MVEVFRTNVKKPGHSKTLVKKLLSYYPQSEVNIDLDDCDKVLRVKGSDICPNKIIELVTLDGYKCEALL